MYVAIDVGGTKTEIGFFKSKKVESLITSTSFPTEQDYEIGREKILSTIREKVNKSKIEGMGVAFAGTVSSEGEIIDSTNISGYEKKPFKKNLEKEFGIKVVVVQDSSCSAVAEYIYGKISKYSRAVNIIMGTGFGSTLLENEEGKFKVSPLETGGIIVQTNDGRKHKNMKTRGFLEAYVGGGTIEHFYKINLANVSDLDPVWNEITDYLAVGINNLSCVLKPKIVVIGGGVGQKRKKALLPVVEKIKKIDGFVEMPKIGFTSIKGNSSLIGALAINFVPNLVLNT